MNLAESIQTYGIVQNQVRDYLSNLVRRELRRKKHERNDLFGNVATDGSRSQCDRL